MNLPFRPPKKKKMQASTARRAREADFTEEPNVKLSSAFVVVLVLHVVAVGGIYAFNAIKAHQPTVYEEAETPQPQAPPQTVSSTQIDALATPAAMPAAPAAPVYYRVQSGDTIAKIAAAYGIGAPALIDINDLRDTGGIHVGQELKLPAGASRPDDQSQPPKPPVAARDSGTIYTVRSGDTPVSIARKLHVVYDDLIRLNKIDDPRKLKIGLKLKVPVKRVTA
jgi:LysM repeat protein